MCQSCRDKCKDAPTYEEEMKLHPDRDKPDFRGGKSQKVYELQLVPEPDRSMDAENWERNHPSNPNFIPADIMDYDYD